MLQVRWLGHSLLWAPHTTLEVWCCSPGAPHTFTCGVAAAVVCLVVWWPHQPSPSLTTPHHNGLIIAGPRDGCPYVNRIIRWVEGLVQVCTKTWVILGNLPAISRSVKYQLVASAPGQHSLSENKLAWAIIFCQLLTMYSKHDNFTETMPT